jgi:putative endonuclease
MAEHLELGKLGENLGAKHLEQKGYFIHYRNWRHHHLEIDIIAEKRGVLHFIEVKTRTTSLYGYPEEQVSRNKLRYLMNAAEAFLLINGGRKFIQFDILSVTIEKGKKVEFYLIEDVYLW